MATSATRRPSRSISTPACEHARAGPEAMAAPTSASRTARFVLRNHSDSWNTPSHAWWYATPPPRSPAGRLTRTRAMAARSGSMQPTRNSVEGVDPGPSATATCPTRFTAGGCSTGGPDAHDFDRERALGARVADGVAGRVVEQRLAEGRRRRQHLELVAAFLDGTHQIGDGGVVTLHLHLDDRSGSDDLTRLAGDHLDAPQDLLELADPSLVVTLLVLRRVVVGVLLDVTVFARPLDPRRDLLATRAGAFRQLLLEPVVGLLRKVRCSHRCRLPAENAKRPRPKTGSFAWRRPLARAAPGSGAGARELRTGVVELAVDLVLQEDHG